MWPARTGWLHGGSIFNWTAHPFNWNAADFQKIILQGDFKTDGTGAFDDDRLSWTINGTSTSSNNQFGVQLDHPNGGIVTYWSNVIGGAKINDVIVPLTAGGSTGTQANTWYRFKAEITKLSPTSARIDVNLVMLDASGNPTGTPFTGSIADTSALAAGHTPAAGYFTPTTMYPSYKNYTSAAAPADNTCFEVVTSSVNHVIIVSVDGFNPDAMTNIPASSIPNLTAIYNGSSTLNARTAYSHTSTLPNNISILTSRPIAGAGGHGYTDNSDPGLGVTLHTNRGAYVAGVFDVAHDHGLFTSMYVSKSKFSLFDTSWNGTNGAPDVTGADNGLDKIDTYLYSTDATSLTNGAIADLTASASSRSVILLHDARPDNALHSSGCGSSQYNNSIIAVDQSLGQIMDAIRNNPALNNRTAIILTADHGCSGTGHDDASDPKNYTIPFMVWVGDGLPSKDLYAINVGLRTNPGTTRPLDAPAANQPVRNADAGNLALDLLGLPAIPNSLVNAGLDLKVLDDGGSPTCYALTLGHSGQGTDPVGTPTNSTGCSAGQYVAGEIIILSGASPASGWQISSWTGTANDTSTVNTNTLTMPVGAHSAVVNYVEPPTGGWTAYNDCVYDPTRSLAATDPNGQLVHYIAQNVTTFGIGTNYSGPISGQLIDKATGNPTGVTASLSQSGGVVWQPDISSSWNGGYDTGPGTDARNTFGGIADMTGVIYYGPDAGWWVDLTMTGLDPARTYTFATSSSRANSTYTTRFTRYTISGVDAATNASTSGVTIVNNATVAFNTGDNHNNGYVARWTNIQPGADGSFKIRAEAHTSENKAYSFDVFMLQEEGGGPTQYNLTVNKPGTGSGTVTSNPAGIDCGGDCTQAYDNNTVVTLTATPAAGSTFTGWTGDLSGNTNPAPITMNSNKTVNATFTRTNTAPVADNQAVTTPEDVPLAITLTGSDGEGDSLTYTVTVQPVNGTLSGAAPNLTYTPAANYNGSDSFTFKVNDGTVDSNVATVSITVNAVNDTPVANAQSVSTPEDTAVAITLVGSDVEGSSLTYSVVTSPANGILTGTLPNLTYTPAVNYNGSDSFTFKVNDGTVDSNVATVSITVNAVNDTPVANAQSVSTPEDTAVAITLVGSDVEGSSLTYSVVTSPANGILTGTLPNLTYTPAANYNGSDSFTFKVNDGTVDSNVATVSITVTAVNDTPVADTQSVSTPEDTTVAITLVGLDVEGSSLTFTVLTQPAHGSLAGRPLT